MRSRWLNHRGITAIAAFVIFLTGSVPAGAEVSGMDQVQTGPQALPGAQTAAPDPTAATALMLFSKQTCAQKNAASADQIVQAAQADQAAQTPPPGAGRTSRPAGSRRSGHGCPAAPSVGAVRAGDDAAVRLP